MNLRAYCEHITVCVCDYYIMVGGLHLVLCCSDSRRAALLTGQKGSDVTAREATRKMVAAASQLQALTAIVQAVSNQAADAAADSAAGPEARGHWSRPQLLHLCRSFLATS